MKNWKTTALGLCTIAGGIGSFIKGEQAAGVTAIIAGIGLLFAKDNNVTGGTVQQ